MSGPGGLLRHAKDVILAEDPHGVRRRKRRLDGDEFLVSGVRERDVGGLSGRASDLRAVIHSGVSAG